VKTYNIENNFDIEIKIDKHISDDKNPAINPNEA
jgi:hypothetical protein